MYNVYTRMCLHYGNVKLNMQNKVLHSYKCVQPVHEVKTRKFIEICPPLGDIKY